MPAKIVRVLQVEAGQVGAVRVMLLDTYGNPVLDPPLQLTGSYMTGPGLITAAQNDLW